MAKEMLSIVMPVYNEEKFLEKIVDRVLKVKWPLPMELIIVDDKSKDNSASIMKTLDKKHRNVRCFYHKQNFGKGRAVRTGFSEAKGTIVTVQDSDLEYFPEDLIPMAYLIMNTKVNAVYGSRYIIPSKGRYWLFYLGNKFLTFSASLLYFQPLTDVLTCYKMVRKSALNGITLREDGFGFDPELSAKLMKKGNKIFEVPIKYVGRTFAEGKKNSIGVGIKTLLILLRERFTP